MNELITSLLPWPAPPRDLASRHICLAKGSRASHWPAPGGATAAVLHTIESIWSSREERWCRGCHASLLLGHKAAEPRLQDLIDLAVEAGGSGSEVSGSD